MTQQLAQSTVYQRVWSGELPSYPIYRNEEQGLMAILDIHPATPGHALVIPAEPVEQWLDLEPHRLRQVMFLSQLVAKHQVRVLAPQKIYNTFFGDDVPHVHNHNIPSYERGVVLPRMSDPRRMKEYNPEALAEMQQRLLFPDSLREYADLELGIMGARYGFMRAWKWLLNVRRLYQGRKAFA